MKRYRAASADFIDHTLVVLFLVGIYLGVEVRLTGNLPLPAALAGAAGLALVAKHANRITERQLMAMAIVIALLTASILSAPNYDFLGERFKGLVQMSYSLIIAYGFFLVAVEFPRKRLAGVFLAFCIVLIIGAALENYVPAFRDISDSFRRNVFATGVYESDVRDRFFYGRIRPKLFTSEPSSLTFGYALFAFTWYVLSRHRLKLFFYVALLAAGYYLMRGPTLLLGVALIPMYHILLTTRRAGRMGQTAIPKIAAALALGAVLATAAGITSSIIFAERIQAIISGQDLSFFARIVAPILTTIAIITEHPISGAGLTGWEYIQSLVNQIYSDAHLITGGPYQFPESAAHGLTNYFWLHWIFLGLFWGCVIILALSWFLRTLGAPSLLFCWSVWVVFGQASGGYVDPRTWIVLLLAAAMSVLHEKSMLAAEARRSASIHGARSARRHPKLELSDSLR